MYQKIQIRGQATNNVPFRMMNASQEGFYHIGSPQSDSLLYSTFPHEYYNNALHNSNICTNHPETIPEARDTTSESSLLSSVMIEQTIIQAALSSIEILMAQKENVKVR